MKKFILALALPTLMTLSASAQKIAHFNRDSILSMMPETKLASTELETFVNQLSDRVKSMQTEREAKEKEFQDAQAKGLSKTILESIAKDIQALDQRIQDFQVSAQNEITTKRNDLLTPILKKVTDAATQVAKEGKYVYVLDSSRMGDWMIYAEKSYDILPLVKKKLNLPDPPAAPTGKN